MSEDAMIRRANLKSLGHGPNDLVRLIGKTYQYWRDLMETNKSFGEKTARNIEEKLSLPRNWLDSAHTNEKAHADSSQDAVVVRGVKRLTEPVHGIQVPLLANAGSMGHGNDMLHDDVMVGAITLDPEWIDKRIKPTRTEALRFIHAYGDSMAPTFSDGDVLLVDTGARNPSEADGVYVLAADHRIFIKRVTERIGGGFDVTSDNPTVKTIGTLNGDHQVDVMGRVVWCWNGKKL